jgi:hypothetical protein
VVISELVVEIQKLSVSKDVPNPLRSAGLAKIPTLDWPQTDACVPKVVGVAQHIVIQAALPYSVVSEITETSVPHLILMTHAVSYVTTVLVRARAAQNHMAAISISAGDSAVHGSIPAILTAHVLPQPMLLFHRDCLPAMGQWSCMDLKTIKISVNGTDLDITSSYSS